MDRYKRRSKADILKEVRHRELSIFGTNSSLSTQLSDIETMLSVSHSTHGNVKDRPKPPLATESNHRVIPMPETDNVQAQINKACFEGNLDMVRELLGVHYVTLMQDEDGRTPLYSACLGNQPEFVRYLVQLGYDVNHQDKQGKTPMFVAFENELKEMLRLLYLDFNASTSIRDARGWTVYHLALDKGIYVIPKHVVQRYFEKDIGTEAAWIQLHAVCHYGDLARVRILVDSGVDIHRVSSSEFTALHVACYYNHLDIVRFLLQRGAETDLERSMRHGWVPLHSACCKAEPELIKELLNRGSDPNATTTNGKTAAHLALEQRNLKAFICLAEWPTTDLNATNATLDTCLHIAVLGRNLEAVTLLLQKHVNVNCLNFYYYTPLHYAINLNDLKMVELLLAARADPNITDVTGNNCLTYALGRGRTSMVEVLLASGVSVRHRNDKGLCALNYTHARLTDQDPDLLLHYFCRSGRVDLVELLLSREGDININKLGPDGSPLQVAYNAGHERLVLFILDAGALQKDPRCRSFLDRIYQNRDRDRAIVEHVILSEKCSVDLAAVDKKQETFLLRACKDGAVDVVSTLLKSTKDIGINKCNKLGKYPLTIVCENATTSATKSEQILSLLVKHKAINLTCSDYTGITPLHIVVRDNSVPLATILLDTSQDLLNCRDIILRTPLHLAPSPEMVRLLVARGGDVGARDLLDRSPLWCCHGQGYHRACEALLDHILGDRKEHFKLVVRIMHLCLKAVTLAVKLHIRRDTADKDKEKDRH